MEKKVFCPENCAIRGNKCPIGDKCPPILTRNPGNPVCRHFKTRLKMIIGLVPKWLQEFEKERDNMCKAEVKVRKCRGCGRKFPTCEARKCVYCLSYICPHCQKCDCAWTKMPAYSPA